MRKKLIVSSLISLFSLLAGCAYSRSGYLVYLPSEADPKYRFFVGASKLDRYKEGEREYLLQISMYEGDSSKTLLLFRKRIRATELGYDYKLTGDRLTVLVTENSKVRSWSFVFERNASGQFILTSEKERP